MLVNNLQMYIYHVHHLNMQVTFLSVQLFLTCTPTVRLACTGYGMSWRVTAIAALWKRSPYYLILESRPLPEVFRVPDSNFWNFRLVHWNVYPAGCSVVFLKDFPSWWPLLASIPFENWSRRFFFDARIQIFASLNASYNLPHFCTTTEKHQMSGKLMNYHKLKVFIICIFSKSDKF